MIGGILTVVPDKCLFCNSLKLRPFREQPVGPSQKRAHFPRRHWGRAP